jgi:hypothetical protein
MRKRQASQRRTTASEENPAQKRDTKRRGEIGEAAFLHKAASMGFGVAKPWGDSDRYDLIVDVPEDIWYVFPPSAFKTMKSMRLFPQHKQRTSKFEQYREAWHEFDAVK